MENLKKNQCFLNAYLPNGNCGAIIYFQFEKSGVLHFEDIDGKEYTFSKPRFTELVENGNMQKR